MLPDSSGHFGIYGGKFVPETLMPALTELEEVYSKAKADPAFKKELEYYLWLRVCVLPTWQNEPLACRLPAYGPYGVLRPDLSWAYLQFLRCQNVNCQIQEEPY